MFSIEELEKALNATNQQRDTLRTHGYSDGAINHFPKHWSGRSIFKLKEVVYVSHV